MGIGIKNPDAQMYIVCLLAISIIVGFGLIVGGYFTRKDKDTDDERAKKNNIVYAGAGMLGGGFVLLLICILGLFKSVNNSETNIIK